MALAHVQRKRLWAMPVHSGRLVQSGPVYESETVAATDAAKKEYGNQRQTKISKMAGTVLKLVIGLDVS